MTFKRKKSMQKAKLCYNEAGLRQDFKPKVQMSDIGNYI